MSNFPGLVRRAGSPNWYFRKYSAEKRAEFNWSTGVPAETSRRREAYKRGIEAYAIWMGAVVPRGASTVRELARAILVEKQSLRPRTLESAEYAWRHLESFFGPLQVASVSTSKWMAFQTAQRNRRGDIRLFNARKLLAQILKRARTEGLITEIPELPLHDPPPAKPKFISRLEYFRILRAFKPRSGIKHLTFIMYHQGARPSEVLGYEWRMVRFGKKHDAEIKIPGSIMKTGRSREIPLNARVARYWERKPLGERHGRIVGVKEYKASWRRVMGRLDMNFTTYNLRDTFITNALSRGESAINIGKYCDTSAAMIEAKYAVGTKEILKRVVGK